MRGGGGAVIQWIVHATVEQSGGKLVRQSERGRRAVANLRQTLEQVQGRQSLQRLAVAVACVRATEAQLRARPSEQLTVAHVKPKPHQCANKMQHKRECQFRSVSEQQKKKTPSLARASQCWMLTDLERAVPLMKLRAKTPPLRYSVRMADANTL